MHSLQNYAYSAGVIETSRRDRKKSETRLALRRAALELSLERGYDNVTIEAITDAADVSARTFFNYFDSKEDAVLGMEQDGDMRVAAAIAARPPHEAPLVAVREVFMQMAGTLADGHALWHQRAELVRANPQLWPRLLASFGKFEAGIATAVATRTGLDPQESVYPAVVAAAAAGAMRVALHQCQPAGLVMDAAALQQRLADTFEVLARGINAPPEAGPC